MTRASMITAGVGITILAAVLRFPGLDDQSLWSDEIYSVESARWPLPVLVTVQDGHPPLYGLALKALDRIRPSDLNGRLISAFAGVATVGAMMALGCAIADRATAVLAALLLTIAPLHVWYSREGRMYALVALCSTAASWLFARALRGGGAAAWLAYALVSAVGLFSHYLYGFVILAQAAFLALGPFGEQTARRRGVIVYGALAVAGALAVSILGAETLGFVGRQRGFQWLALPYTAYTFLGGFGLGPPTEYLHRGHSLATTAATYWIPISAVALLAALLVWPAAQALRTLGVWAIYLALWIFVPAVGVFAGAWLMDGAYNVRYLILTLPAVVMLLAAGIARVPRWYGAVCLAAFAAVATASISRDRSDPRYMREDLRATVSYLRQHAGAGEAVTVSAHYVIEGLKYYGADQRLEALAVRPVPSASEADALIAGLSGSGGWLVLSRDWEEDPAGYLDHAIATRAPNAEVASLPGVRIFRFGGREISGPVAAGTGPTRSIDSR